MIRIALDRRLTPAEWEKMLDVLIHMGNDMAKDRRNSNLAYEIDEDYF